ncbi:MAG: hypothetical protein PVJ57_06895 [Phycisphaerae bacterium]|jgi:hypothetical protein
MLGNLRNIVIWQYDPATPESKLRRHYRITRAVTYASMASAVTAVSACAKFVLLPSSGTVSLIVLVVASLASIVLALPGVVASFWALEIEKVLAKRGSPIRRTQSVEKRVANAALKVMFWAVVLVLVLHFIGAPRSA